MQDRLQEIFNLQKKINQDLLNLSVDDKQNKSKQFSLAVSGELYEFLDTFNWCDWKKNKQVIITNSQEELVDIQKFLINLMLIWDFDADTFFEAFKRKSIVVEQRIKQMKALKEIKEQGLKVCAIDLDGVLVQFPDHFINFVNQKKGTKFTNLFEVKKNTDNAEYLQLKREYRETGQKQYIPFNDYAKQLIDSLRSKGFSIVILTARPYKQYFRLFADTKKSLDDSHIAYDAIVFDSQKHHTIIKELPKLEFMIEDNRNIANEVGSWGYKCFLIDNIYNQGDLNENVTRVKDLREIENILKEST